MCHDEESHQQVKKEWLRAVYTAETAGKLSDPVPRREFQGSSVKISEALKEVMKKKKEVPQSTISFGSLVPHVGVKGIQIALNVYSSGFRGVIGELGEIAQFPWGYKLFSLYGLLSELKNV